MTPPAIRPAIELISNFADIIAQETQDGRFTVQFLIEAMQGEFPDFKPCHRISAAKELLQRGFDYLPEYADVPESADAAAPKPEPELTSEDLAAQRRAERIEFSKHGPRYYRNYAFPCVCEDRLHDCEGNPLDEEQLERTARRPPAMEYLLLDPEQMDDFLARYAEYLIGWNAEHPGNPIDINRFVWTNPTWRHLLMRERLAKHGLLSSDRLGSRFRGNDG